METKRSNFNGATTAIHIIIKDLWNAHSITAKVYEKDPQALSEVIKLVVKLKTAQQVTATLSLPMVNMMSNNDRWFVCSKTDQIGHPLCSITTMKVLVIVPRNAQRKFSHQEHLIITIDHAPLMLQLQPQGQITIFPSQMQPGKLLWQVRITLSISTQQKLQQLPEACIPLFILPPQQLMILIYWKML